MDKNCQLKAELSPSKKIFMCVNGSPLIMVKNTFCFILKALLLFKVSVLKFQNLGRRKLVNKQLQYTYSQYLTN